MFRTFCYAIALVLLNARATAQFALPSEPDTIASTAILVSENLSISPGQPFTLALELAHPDGWHSYYKNSGGIEQSPSITWELPPGFSAGPIQWPVPEIKKGDFGTGLIYPGSPVFLVEITPPAALPTGQAFTFTANAHWQICDQSCIDESAELTVTLSSAANAAKDSAHTAFFTAARSNIPENADGWTFAATPDGDSTRLKFTSATGEIPDLQAAFIPDQPFILAEESPETTPLPGGLDLKLTHNTVDLLDQPIPKGDSLSGILLLTTPAGTRSLLVPETPIAGPDSSAAAPAPTPLAASRFLGILGGMLLGGLILNLMPCVFPVIGLKIMGFVQQSGQDRKKIVFHGLSFTAGVLLSFAVISGILFSARTAAGSSSAAAWGYQLQNPWVVLFLILLMFVLALNMFGVFEIGASATSVGGNLQSKQGLTGSFLSGILATIVATPCSAPFLGVAIGVAVTLPAAQFFAAFAAMAIGLALPYLVLSTFPKLVDLLPRPGAWMESFKQAMSFLLFATAGYLLVVYAGLIGLENLPLPIFGLSAIAVACWIYGRWHLPHRQRSTRLAAAGFALVFAAAGLFLAKPPQPSTLTWEPWSQQKVDTLLAQGTPVYVDFTAQWCLTCQVNKKVAYTKDVIGLMNRKNIVALRADKTRPDAAIDAKLKELGRSAIPVNVLLVPGKDPIITPEILTPGYLTDLFNREIP